MDRYYTLPPDIYKNTGYRGLQATLDRLSANPEVIQRFPGNCISASDIVQHILEFYGVKSRLVECQVMIIKGCDNSQKDIKFIGFNNVGITPSTIDTHLVVVTETVPPMLIDASLGHCYGEKNSIFIRELLSDLRPNLLGEFILDDLSITYQAKKEVKMPMLHQKNLVDRIEEDIKTKSKIKNLFLFFKVLLALTLINMIFNITSIILKLMWP